MDTPLHPTRHPGTTSGFTLIEVVSVLTIVGILTAMAMPKFAAVMTEGKIVKAIADIRAIEIDLLAKEAGDESLPETLDEIGRGSLLDPWGHPYVYLNFHGDDKPQGARKDHAQHPLNADFDLYSMGEDGQTAAPITAKKSQDDIIRANDGGFIGLARLY